MVILRDFPVQLQKNSLNQLLDKHAHHFVKFDMEPEVIVHKQVCATTHLFKSWNQPLILYILWLINQLPPNIPPPEIAGLI